MRVLIVYDGAIRLRALERPWSRPSAITLFALTSDFAITDKVEAALRRAGCSEVRRLDSAHLVDRQVNTLRDGICEWSRAVGEATIAGRSVRERLMLRGMPLSAWWLGLLAEKNTLKTQAYLRIAQALAVDAILQHEQFDQLTIAVADRALRLSLAEIARGRSLPVHEIGRPWRGRLAAPWRSRGAAAMAATAIAAWLRLNLFACFARVALGRPAPVTNRLCGVSYFPAFDKEAASSGRYVNRYTGPLQDLLDRLGVGVTWLLIWAPLDGARYRDSLRLVRRFRAVGASMFMAEAFWGARAAAWAFAEWLRLAWLSTRLRAAGDAIPLTASPLIAACRPIVNELWHESFVGPNAMKAVCFAALFRGAWPKMPSLSACVYISEMHAWEKALNATLAGAQVTRIAFQHTAVSRNYFHYFHSAAETRTSGAADSLPLPDVMAANGRLTCAALAACGYPGLTEVESLRYIGLDAALREPRQRTDRPTLLVAGSLDRAESLALARLVHQAFPDRAAMDIVFKAHPYTPFEGVLDELGVDAEACGYVMGKGAIGEHLRRAWAVVVPSSAVAVEALAYGCPVIVPVFADSMLMNPLAEFPQVCQKVSDPRQLRESWQRIAGDRDDGQGEARREFVREYWHLDADLPRWTALLNRVAGTAVHPAPAR